MYDGCLIDFALIFKGFRTHVGPKFHFEKALGWTLGLFWAYFGIMEGHWRGGAEPDAGKSLSEWGEPGGASPFWVQKWVCEPPESTPKPPQRPPKSNKSREKQTFINELINFIRLKVDFWWVWMPKWWFFQTSFEDQTINWRKCRMCKNIEKRIVF